MLKHILKRQLLIATRSRRDWIEALSFFTIIIILLPVSMPMTEVQSSALHIGIIWIGVLLAGFLSLERILRTDFETGVLEQLLLMPQTLMLTLFGKAIAHWLVYGLPLALLAPIYGVLLSLPANTIGINFFALVLGTLIVTFIGLIGAALTVCLQRSSLLIGLLVMPLYLPVIIFGSDISHAAVVGLATSGQFAFLGAMLLLLLILSPFFASVSLRIMLD